MDVLCVGQLVADILVKPVDSVDFSVDTQKIDLIEVKNGGDCLNTAIGLAKLGNKVGFVGKIGNDQFGDFLTDVIKQYDIDIKGLKIADNVATSAVVVLISKSGERTFLYYGGANDSFKFEDIEPDVVDSTKIVHVGGTYQLPDFDGYGAAKLFELARSKNKITSMDVTWDTSGKWLKTIQPCLKYLNFFMPSYQEAKMITKKEQPEDIAAFLQNEGVDVVIIKLGKDGSYIKSRHEAFYCPSYATNVVDTTGAGDSFVAGFLTGVLKDWNLAKCAQVASGVSAFCIQHLGATTGIPSFTEVNDFIKKRSV
jgi:sugar/nucleoside kinase (ribokinase family)